VSRCSTHAVRHFAASVWIEAGFSPKRLQALLGHSSIQMTFDRYGHLFPSVEDDHGKLPASSARSGWWRDERAENADAYRGVVGSHRQ
jgi:hypothetical protein